MTLLIDRLHGIQCNKTFLVTNCCHSIRHLRPLFYPPTVLRGNKHRVLDLGGFSRDTGNISSPKYTLSRCTTSTISVAIATRNGRQARLPLAMATKRPLCESTRLLSAHLWLAATLASHAQSPWSSIHHHGYVYKLELEAWRAVARAKIHPIPYYVGD